MPGTELTQLATVLLVGFLATIARAGPLCEPQTACIWELVARYGKGSDVARVTCRCSGKSGVVFVWPESSGASGEGTAELKPMASTNNVFTLELELTENLYAATEIDDSRSTPQFLSKISYASGKAKPRPVTKLPPSTLSPLVYEPLRGPPDGQVFDSGLDAIAMASQSISQIRVTRGAVVDGLQLAYRRDGAAEYFAPQHGTMHHVETLTLGEGEWLESVTGFYGPTPPPGYGERVFALTFTTNKGNKLGPIGNRQTDKDKAFEWRRAGKRIVGFHGRVADTMISSLGAIFADAPKPRATQ